MLQDKLEIYWCDFNWLLTGKATRRGFFVNTEYNARVKFNNKAKVNYLNSKFNLKCTKCSVSGYVKATETIYRLHDKERDTKKILFTLPQTPNQNGRVYSKGVMGDIHKAIDKWAKIFNGFGDVPDTHSDYESEFTPRYIECHLEKTPHNMEVAQYISSSKNNIDNVNLISKNRWFSDCDSTSTLFRGMKGRSISSLNVENLDDEIVITVLFINDFSELFGEGNGLFGAIPGMVYAPFVPAQLVTPMPMDAPKAIMAYLDTPYTTGQTLKLGYGPPMYLDKKDAQDSVKKNKWKNFKITFNDKPKRIFKKKWKS